MGSFFLFGGEGVFCGIPLGFLLLSVICADSAFRDDMLGFLECVFSLKAVKAWGWQAYGFADLGLIDAWPRGSIYTSMTELSPKIHNGDGLFGPNSIMVLYVDPLGGA